MFMKVSKLNILILYIMRTFDFTDDDSFNLVIDSISMQNAICFYKCDCIQHNKFSVRIDCQKSSLNICQNGLS